MIMHDVGWGHAHGQVQQVLDAAIIWRTCLGVLERELWDYQH
jgi:hypothetical protein